MNIGANPALFEPGAIERSKKIEPVDKK